MDASSAACRDCVYCNSPLREKRKAMLSTPCGKCGHAQRWHSGDFVAPKRWNKPKAPAAAAPQAQVVMQVPAARQMRGWFEDPFGRFQWRWHDGDRWTDFTANEIAYQVDPIPAPR